MNGDPSQPRTSSKTGLILGVLVVSAVVGFLIGRATAPTPAPPVCPTPVPTAATTPVATDPCTDPGSKAIAVSAAGGLSCYDAWLWTTSNDEAVWTAPAGSTLVIAFKDQGIFNLQSSASSPNKVSSGSPLGSAPHNTPFPYAAYVYGRGTPTPKPGTPTPTPATTQLGRIIIKP